MPDTHDLGEPAAGPGVDEREMYDRIERAVADNYQGTPVNPAAVATIATAAAMSMLTDHANSHGGEHGDDLRAALGRVRQVCHEALAVPDAPDRWAVAAQVRAALEGPAAVSEQQEAEEVDFRIEQVGHGTQLDFPLDPGVAAALRRAEQAEAEAARASEECAAVRQQLTATRMELQGVRREAAAVVSDRDSARRSHELQQQTSGSLAAKVRAAEAALARVRELADRLGREPHPSHDHLCPDDVRAELLTALDRTAEQTGGGEQSPDLGATTTEETNRRA